MAIRCVNRITASKVFRASSRKQKILAAMEDPINKALVEQLEEYIGDEYKKPKPTESDEVSKIDTESTEPEVAGDGAASDRPSAGRPSAGGPKPKLSEKYGKALDEEVGAVGDETEEPDSDEGWGGDDTSGTADKESPNSSIKAVGTPVVAETVLDNTPIGIHISIDQLAGELKGTLNARSETAGVVRAAVRGDEVWVYYNDSINLNNVMADVIDLLAGAGYYYLIFNRLARTDNAIVFTISQNDTDVVIGDDNGEESSDN